MIGGHRAGVEHRAPQQPSRARPRPADLRLGTQPAARPGPALAPAAPPARTGRTVTTGEFARLMRMSTGAIRHACERGEIPGAARIGHVWRIPVSSIPTYRKA